MTSVIAHALNISKEFLDGCLDISTQVGNQSPISSTDILVPPTAFSSGEFSLPSHDERTAAVDNVDSKATRLTDKYANAYTDFYGSGTPCVFKSGPAWHVREGPQAQGIVREARPVYRHAIGPTWLAIGKRIYDNLDSIGVQWTSINPLAYADAGVAKPFCPLVLSIGVKPHSLLYDAAVAAATIIKGILAEASFPAIEVAFVESVVTRSFAVGRKLLSFDPLDDVSDLRKPFTAALGLSIAPLKYPYFEGTAALYFRLGKDDKTTAILTCAHVACLPSVYTNMGMAGRKTRPTHEKFVALGDTGYSNAITAMIVTIGNLLRSIEVWNDTLSRLGEPVEGENSKVTERRKEHVELVAKAMKKIKEVNALHDEVTRYHATPNWRVIGFVRHSENIEVSDEPHNFTKDWALIELYNEKIDWATFKGNKVYIGGNLSAADFHNTMFPHPVDQANYQYPQDGLLQAYSVVQDDEIHDPQHLDVYGEKCLLVVKNGMSTGPPSVAPTVSSRLPVSTMNTAPSTPPSTSPSCPTTRHAAIFPMLATPGPSFSPGMVASLESSPVVQALLTRPTSRTSPPTGGSNSRSRPSTPTASSTRSSS
ncbi:hypothetical protein BKA82DRAFT_1000160, partial [Pisolithus tinctorius]